MNFSTLAINRFTVHKVFSKRDLKKESDDAPYAEEAEDFCKLSPDGISTLETRILKATLQKKRFFELDIEKTGKHTFWDYAKEILGSQRKHFLESVNFIAAICAEAHDKGNIPGGLLLLIEAQIDSYATLIVVKAEKSDAFSLNGSDIQLVKDIFLSSDKTLYKIGFLVRVDSKSVDKQSFKCFVYDDSFSPVKEDLAFYFYNTFLGLSTEKNSKIQTNNFYNYFKDFVGTFVEGWESQNHVQKIVDQDMMDKTKKIIHPDEYKQLFPEKLSPFYDENVIAKLPAGIPKDTTVLSDIQTKRIKINESALLVTKNGISEDILIGTSTDTTFNQKKKAVLDTGKKYIEVMIPESSISDITKQDGPPKKK